MKRREIFAKKSVYFLCLLVNKKNLIWILILIMDSPHGSVSNICSMGFEIMKSFYNVRTLLVFSAFLENSFPFFSAKVSFTVEILWTRAVRQFNSVAADNYNSTSMNLYHVKCTYKLCVLPLINQWHQIMMSWWACACGQSGLLFLCAATLYILTLQGDSR